ncbi:MAG: general secretion pathway protein GspK [Deltaproteobacteria bacterium]|nr:MAG: general secretion pathway protein GspK [Deltaproteobacteria bacterium]
MVSQIDRRTARGGGIGDQRGVALIMVVSVVAILTAVTVQFTYQERVNLHLAANARDELRAYYLARSSVNLSRLLLSFQKRIDSTPIPGLQQLTSLLGGGAPPAAGAGAPAGGASTGALGIRLWELIPIDCGLVQMFVQMNAAAPEGPNEESPEEAQLADFGTFEGACHAEITDEDSKINLNHLDGLERSVKNVLIQLIGLMQDPRYDFLFEKEDRWGIRMTRPELIVAIRDYIDENQVQETLILGPDGPELLPGAGDEGYYYTRFEPQYSPKNAPFDSLDELYMVAGIGDDFMAAFGDRLTVYTGKNAKLNVTPQNMVDLCLRIVIASENPAQGVQYCQDPVLMNNLWEQIQLQRAMLPWIGMTPESFRALLEANGIPVNRFIWSGPGAIFGNSSNTFRIEASGRAGDVEKTIVAVVRMDGADPLGTLLYWKEK